VKQVPKGIPTTEDFTTVSEQVPQDESELRDGQILVKLLYVSVDPYLRLVMLSKPNEPVISDALAQIVASKDDGYKAGEYLRGWFPWQQYVVITRADLVKSEWSDTVKIHPDPNIPIEKYLNVFMPVIHSAAYGIFEARLEKGSVVLVSGAAGAVGSLVGQFAKMKGCTVIGIAGSDEKCKMLKEELHFDATINYKKCKDMKEAIRKVAPEGIDVYFDCVGGDIFDAAVLNLKTAGHVIIVGRISTYNEDKPETLPLANIIFRNSLKVQGHNFMLLKNRHKEIEEQMHAWYKEGKIKSVETVKSGPIDQLPKTFIGLFSGANTGKMIHKLSDSPAQ